MDGIIAQQPLVLASRSPRRAEILQAVGWTFSAVPADVDETRIPHEDATEYVRRVARAKALAVAQNLPEAVVLGADTVVLIDGEILGQPRDDNDARRMLRLLSGRWHEVLTGVALIRGPEDEDVQVHQELTRVRFAKLTESEIEWYVATGEPMNKAGAYGIQGKAALFIEEIRGDYFNVVGLPIRLVYKLLREL